MFKRTFLFYPKGSVIKLPGRYTNRFCLCSPFKIGNTAIGCEINGNKSELQSILRNGDTVKIIFKNNSHLYIGYQRLKQVSKVRYKKILA